MKKSVLKRRLVRKSSISWMASKMSGQKPPSSRLLAFIACFIVVLMVALITLMIVRLNGSPNEFSPAEPEKYMDPRPRVSTNEPTTQKSSISSTTTISRKKPRNVCETPECITLAQHLHNWRDITVDPCQDFYKAVCGKYSEHTLTDGTRFHKNTHLVTKLVKEFLEKNETSESRSESLMRAYYRKCTEYHDKKNYVVNSNVKWREVIQLIRKIGSFPLLDPYWDESKFDLNDILAGFAKMKLPFFGFFSIIPQGNYSLMILDAPSPVKLKPFGKNLKVILNINDVAFNESTVDTDLKDYEKLKNEFAEFATQSKGSAEFSSLQNQTPSIDFERIIKILISSKTHDDTWNLVKNKITVTKQQVFFNESKNLETILTATPKRTLANFLMFHLVNGFADDSEDCATRTIKDFSFVALRAFIHRHFDKENLQLASNLVDDIKGSLIETFQESKWLHEETKKNGIRKVKMMKKIIGYPEEFDPPGTLDKFYESLDFSSHDSYFSMVLKNLAFVYQNLLRMDGVPYFYLERKTKILTANAFHYPNKNWLGLNVAFLDDPFLDSTYPKYATIASIGAVIGHEMGHGFDPEGRKRDEVGQERNWWTLEDLEEYDRRTQCLIDQYDNYDDPHFGKNLNGSQTIEEIVSDIIGVHLAWKTYKKLDISAEADIIGFEDDSKDKLFYHIKALNWCRNRYSNSLAEQLEKVHPTSSFRVNGIFSNMKQFAEAFNCPVGSPMNPEKKCELF